MLRPGEASAVTTDRPPRGLTLALDVDGVLLDPDRGGTGHWSSELTARFGIDPEAFRRAFFVAAWDDVVTGRRPIEPALADGLLALGSTASVDQVLECWFEADFCLIEPAIAFARWAAASGARVVLATNQEHRRARFLMERLGAAMPLDSVVHSAAVGAQKHEAIFYDRASERLGILRTRRREVVFVDDVLDNVIQARASGWTAIHADPAGKWIEEAERALRVT